MTAAFDLISVGYRKQVVAASGGVFPPSQVRKDNSFKLSCKICMDLTKDY
jgi:hypothetical protein